MQPTWIGEVTSAGKEAVSWNIRFGFDCGKETTVAACSATTAELYSNSIQCEEVAMRLSKRVKPISYVKANAAEILADLAETGEPLAITVNGEVKAIIQDIRSYEETQEAIALLQMLAMGDREIEAGDYRPVEELVQELKGKRAA
jgi:prevent-host-death family protein